MEREEGWWEEVATGAAAGVGTGAAVVAMVAGAVVEAVGRCEGVQRVEGVL